MALYFITEFLQRSFLSLGDTFFSAFVFNCVPLFTRDSSSEAKDSPSSISSSPSDQLFPIFLDFCTLSRKSFTKTSTYSLWFVATYSKSSLILVSMIFKTNFSFPKVYFVPKADIHLSILNYLSKYISKTFCFTRRESR